MDSTVLKTISIAVASFIVLQVCVAMPVDLEDTVSEYEPSVGESVYTESCVLCYAFQHAGACELCRFIAPDTDIGLDDDDGDVIKRSGDSFYHPFLRGGYQGNAFISKRSGDSFYHPFLRGGYPKKSYYYNPLLRGGNYKKSYTPKQQIYHPFLRGGFGNYNPMNLPRNVVTSG